MKILVCSNAYKGSFTSTEISREIYNILKENNDVEVLSLSDGGDSLIEAYKANYSDAQEVFVNVNSPMLDAIVNVKYLIHNNIAIIPSSLGLNYNYWVKNNNPAYASSYGLGQVIKDALGRGIREFIIGIGGTLTNDMGIGALAALGLVFENANGPFIPNPSNFDTIINIDFGLFNRDLIDSHFTLLTDVDNPLLGESGATYTFSKQKGMKDIDIPYIEENIRYLTNFIRYKYNKDFSNEKGSGAGGGIVNGFRLFLNAKVQSGSDYFLDLYDFSRKINDFNLVITGEGKVDLTSFNGKLLGKIISIVPNEKLLILSGYIDDIAKNYLIKNKIKFVSLYDHPLKDNEVNKSETLELIKNNCQDLSKIQISNKELLK
jgi:glycerate kinase